MAPITATMAENGNSKDLIAILDAGAQYGKVSSYQLIEVYPYIYNTICILGDRPKGSRIECGITRFAFGDFGVSNQGTRLQSYNCFGRP